MWAVLDYLVVVPTDHEVLVGECRTGVFFVYCGPPGRPTADIYRIYAGNNTCGLGHVLVTVPAHQEGVFKTRYLHVCDRYVYS